MRDRVDVQPCFGLGDINHVPAGIRAMGSKISPERLLHRRRTEPCLLLSLLTIDSHLQGANDDTASWWCRSIGVGSSYVECSRGPNTERYRRQCIRMVSMVGLLPARRSLHDVGWLPLAQHVLALSDLCPSDMGALSALSAPTAPTSYLESIGAQSGSNSSL